MGPDGLAVDGRDLEALGELGRTLLGSQLLVGTDLLGLLAVGAALRSAAAVAATLLAGLGGSTLGGSFVSIGVAAVAGRLHGAEIAAGSGHGHGDDEGEAEADLTKQSKGRDVHGESPVRSLAQRSGAGVHATRESHLGTGG